MFSISARSWPWPVGFGMRLGALLIAATFAGSAVGAERPIPWGVRVWQAEDGLPDNRVVGLAQTPDGYLWVATRGGLVRFNGAAFEPFSFANLAGVSGNGIRAMWPDSQGNLWLDTFRRTIVRIGPDAVRSFTEPEGVAGGEMSALAESATGAVYLALGGRLHVVEEDRLRPLNERWRSLTRDHRGQLWAARDRTVGLVEGDRVTSRFPLVNQPVQVTAARGGGLWIVSGDQLHRLREGESPSVRGALVAGSRPSCLLEDRAGALWIGTEAHGLWRYDGHSLVAVETSHRGIACLLEDREGNIWVGTQGGGLGRLRPRALEFTGVMLGSSFEPLVSVCEDAQGHVWSVTTQGQLARDDGTGWRLMPADTPWPTTEVTCVTADVSGMLWVGTNRHGLHRVGLRDRSVQSWRPPELPGNSVRALFVASDGALWVATSDPARVARVTAAGVVTMETPADVRTFRSITEGPVGTVWFGTSDGRVLKAIGSRMVPELAIPRAALTTVRGLHATPEGSLWIGDGDRGVSWLQDGRLVRFSTANGLSDDSIWQVTTDRSGALWIAGPRGLSRVTREDAQAVAAGRQPKLRTMVFGRGEALRSFQAHYGNTPAVWRTRDGRLLFATSQGLLVLNPENLRDNPLPPPVALERVTLDDRIVALSDSRFPLRRELPPEVLETRDTEAVLRLPPQHRRIAFDFAALSFSAPENVRFRHRLEGIEETWTEIAGERSARYPRLPAGRYTFRVTASNEMGVWNEQGAALAIVVRPFFWQIWWFWLGGVIAFTAAVAALVRVVSFRRLRRRLEVAEQISALSQERARIARDIHDDVGSSLAHIKLLSELAVRDRTSADAGEDYLHQITGTTRQMLKSLDEIVWAINPRNDTLPSLISYVGQYAVEFLRAAGLRCEVDLPENPPEIAVASDVRHHVFLVVKEALTNVARHAQARTVQIQARVTGKALEVVIADDGAGFDVGSEQGEGDGVRNMRQRMATLGGAFELESRRGAGTRLRLQVVVR